MPDTDQGATAKWPVVLPPVGSGGGRVAAGSSSSDRDEREQSA